MKYKCASCGTVCGAEELNHAFPDIPNLLLRLNPGGEVPAGECPDCGALAYVVDATPDPDPDPGYRRLFCPSCGQEDCMARVDIVPGYANISGVCADGSLDWSGDTDVQWDDQRPESNPAEFVCTVCEARYSAAELGIKEDAK